MNIETTLPCGVTINVIHYDYRDVVTITITDPGKTSFYSNDRSHLFIAIHKSNIPVLRQLLNELESQPEPGFWARIREAFRLLNTPQPNIEVIPHVGLNEIVRN